MRRLGVSILGVLEVHDGSGAVVAIGGARLRALLVRLALDAGRAVSVGALIEALWDEEPPDGAANALQSLVSRLRRALVDPDAVASVPGGYTLAVPASAVDANRFETLAGEGRDALGSGDAESAAHRFREALSLWRGAALADVADSRFAVAPAARLEELRLATLCARIDADLRLGRRREVIPELEALAVAHPLREDIAALLVKALHVVGRQADALAAYDRIRAALAEDLGIDPSGELAEVHLAVLRNEPAFAPAPAQAPAAASGAPIRGTGRRGNLRSTLTSFVGRTEEVTRIEKLLDASRLATLVGPGGAGKTRLACEAAARLLAQSPDSGLTADGAWLAELAPVTDPAEVPQAVLAALGPRETRVMSRDQQAPPARDTLTRLTDILSDKDLVLVLDNCEHVIDAAARLADHLLGHCPGLRIIATSREPLVIPGENIYPVQPLVHPADGCPVVDALAYPAVRLFVDRAAAGAPGFALDEANIAHVVQICRRLDGLPLAIELAAARLRTLPVQAVAARLDDRFRLLTGGSRTAMPRHQTLRAVVTWSWELLDDAERDLAERLSVFPGGVCADSAASVHPASPHEISGLLSALVDKSLLQPMGVAADGEPRYRMLETIREYGIEHLAEAGTSAEVRAAHARYFLDLVERAEPHLRRREQLEWIARLVAERDNILAALRYAIDVGDTDTAVRMAAVLVSYWVLGGDHNEGMGWLGLVVDMPGESPPDAYAICRIYHAATTLFTHRQWAEMTLVLRDELNAAMRGPAADSSHPMLALAQILVPMLEHDLDGVNAALRRLTNAPDPWVSAAAHLMRGLSAENEGDIATQRADLFEARARFEALGERWGLAATLGGLAGLAASDGDPAAALTLHDRALTLMQEVNATDDADHAQIIRGSLLAQVGEMEAARALMETTLENAHRGGSSSTAFMARQGLAELARLSGDIDGAWAHMRAPDAQDTENWHGPPQVWAIREICKAHLHLAVGDFEAARESLVAAVDKGRESADMPVVSRVAVAVGCYVADRGGALEGAGFLGVSAGLRGMVDHSDHDRRRLEERLRSEVGDAAFERAFAAGRATPREQAEALLARVLESPAAHDTAAAPDVSAPRREHDGQALRR
ncbi:MAG TPA: BTAD domain-containing putative transcriptional regulator [Actinocrinis sp.]|nr:BTAD domain-containing putative transcriptional regulator [Actinocrinis sp.]